jgi:hypothetical protein
MMQVQNELAAPEQRIVEPNGGILAWLPHNDDTGLGFMQGSTQGVFNTYGKRGFLRPELPVVDREVRRRFNLRGYRGAREGWSCGWPYACHYDPEPFYQEKGVDGGDDDVWAHHDTHNSRQGMKIKQSKRNGSSTLLFIGGLIALGVLFSRQLT